MCPTARSRTWIGQGDEGVVHVHGEPAASISDDGVGDLMDKNEFVELVDEDLSTEYQSIGPRTALGQ
jgi:hypothetical protein